MKYKSKCKDAFKTKFKMQKKKIVKIIKSVHDNLHIINSDIFTIHVSHCITFD